jgi:chromosome segregation ATPase
MNAERDLAEAYQEWRRLAETEGEAIGAGNWSLVSACQKSLQHLQERISRLSPAARKEWSKSENDLAAKEEVLNATIHELINLEKRNQTLLQAIQATTRVKLDQLGQAGRNLRQIQQSYGAGHPAFWNSFS